MIQDLKKVGPELRVEIDSLIQDSAEADGFETELYTDASINAYKDMACAFTCKRCDRLAGFLFVFAPTQTEIEVSALVHPEFRRQGIFKILLNEAFEECSKFGYSQGFLVCNEASADGLQTLSHWNYEPDHVEYQMYYENKHPASLSDSTISLVKATLMDVKEAAPLLEETFGFDKDTAECRLLNNINSPDRTQWILKRQDQIIGFCGAYQERQTYNVFGLGILPSERRKGYARIMLDLVAIDAIKHGVNSLKLDVDSDNPNAIGLYRSYGFECKSGTRYYRITL